VLPGDGADIVSYPYGRAFYALKGNKTLEFWRYRMKPIESEDYPAGSEGATAAARPLATTRLEVVPNPVPGSSALLRCTVPASGSGVVTIYDATGRVAAMQKLELARSGSVSLDLSGLAAGTYVLRLAGDRYTATGRLLVAR
jgi:hypothetical protein